MAQHIFTSIVDGNEEEYKVQNLDIGNMSDLETTEKDTVVGAINELVEREPPSITAAQILSLFEE